MFGPRTTVDVHDVYTNDDYTIDNVPFGIAAIGGITSTISHNITESLEGTFTLPKMSEGGFNSAPKALVSANRMRTFGPSAQVMTQRAADDPTHPYEESTDRAFANYMRDCVIPAAKNGYINFDGAMTSGSDFWAALVVDDDRSSTVLPIYPAGGTPPGGPMSTDGYTVSCKQAHSDLTGRLDQIKQPFEAYMDSQIGDKSQERIAAALNAFSDSTVASKDDAARYTINSVTYYLLQKSMLGENTADMTPTNVMLAQALTQRDVQWASEGSVFLSVVRPIMAFFEGLFYTLTPLIGFLIGMGMFGQKLIADYIRLSLWIQAMPPIMAVVNLYYNFTIQHELVTLAASQINFQTMSGILAIQDQLSHWIATAGMIAGSVPVISATLVYGGSYAATNLAGRVAGGDFVNEKIVAPDAVQPGAVASVAPGRQVQTGMSHGYSAMAESYVPTAQLSNTIGSSITSMQSQAESESQSLSRSIYERMSNTSDVGKRAEMANTLDHALTESKDQRYAVVKQATLKWLEDNGYDKSWANDMATRAMFDDNLSGGIGGKGNGGPFKATEKIPTELEKAAQKAENVAVRSGKQVAGALAGALDLKFSRSDQASIAESESYRKAVSVALSEAGGSDQSRGSTSSLNESSGASLRNAFARTGTQSLSKAFGDDIGKKADSAIAIENRLQTAQQASQQWNLALRDNQLRLAERAAQDPEAVRAAERIINSSAAYQRRFDLDRKELERNGIKGDMAAIVGAERLVAQDKEGLNLSSPEGQQKLANLEQIYSSAGYRIDQFDPAKGGPNTQGLIMGGTGEAVRPGIETAEEKAKKAQHADSQASAFVAGQHTTTATEGAEATVLRDHADHDADVARIGSDNDRDLKKDQKQHDKSFKAGHGAAPSTQAPDSIGMGALQATKDVDITNPE